MKGEKNSAGVMELCSRVLPFFRNFREKVSLEGALEEQFKERKNDQQLIVYGTCILVTLAIYVPDFAVHGFGGHQLVYRLCSCAQWAFMVCMYMLFSKRRRLLRFYDGTTSLIAMWNNTYVLLTPTVLDVISGTESLEADEVEARTSTGIIRAMAAVLVCGFFGKVNTLHFIAICLHVLTWWIICTSLQGSKVHELICPLLSLAFLLALCSICVRNLQKLERTVFLQTVQVASTPQKSNEVQERLPGNWEAFSRLLSVFCDAVFMTDVDFRVVTHQEQYCSMKKLYSIFGRTMDNENLLDHLYDSREQEKFNTRIAVTPLTADISLNLRFRVSQEHSGTDLLETSVYIVPTACGRLVAICAKARVRLSYKWD